MIARNMALFILKTCKKTLCKFFWIFTDFVLDKASFGLHAAQIQIACEPSSDFYSGPIKLISGLFQIESYLAFLPFETKNYIVRCVLKPEGRDSSNFQIFSCKL